MNTHLVRKTSVLVVTRRLVCLLCLCIICWLYVGVPDPPATSKEGAKLAHWLRDHEGRNSLDPPNEDVAFTVPAFATDPISGSKVGVLERPGMLL